MPPCSAASSAVSRDRSASTLRSSAADIGASAARVPQLPLAGLYWRPAAANAAFYAAPHMLSLVKHALKWPGSRHRKGE